MDSERIHKALNEIEDALPPAQAQVRFDVYGGGVDESFIRGTRAGLAQLGVRLIRAALKPEQSKSINGGSEVERPLDDLIHPDSDVKFDWIELSDDLEREPPVRAQTERALKRTSLIGCLFVVLVVLASLIWCLRKVGAFD